MAPGERRLSRCFNIQRDIPIELDADASVETVPGQTLGLGTKRRPVDYGDLAEAVTKMETLRAALPARLSSTAK